MLDVQCETIGFHTSITFHVVDLPLFRAAILSHYQLCYRRSMDDDYHGNVLQWTKACVASH